MEAFLPWAIVMSLLRSLAVASGRAVGRFRHLKDFREYLAVTHVTAIDATSADPLPDRTSGIVFSGADR